MGNMKNYNQPYFKFYGHEVRHFNSTEGQDLLLFIICDVNGKPFKRILIGDLS